MASARGTIVPNLKRILFWTLYRGFASRLPNRPRIFRRVRSFFASGYCVDVSRKANINRNVRLSPDVTIAPHGGVGANSELSGEVHIGAHVTMGPGCVFITGDHPVPGDYGNFRDHTPTHRAISIEEDAFIGARVLLLPGVTVGRGAVVGAGAVVAKNVAAGAVVVGNPAKEIRRRKVER